MLQIVNVNGEPGVLVRDGARVTAIMAFDLEGDRIATVYGVINPEKLPN